jgi:NAD(P)-dependent dehydrogenase (short-subunit alcohol dehydrogenase family)
MLNGALRGAVRRTKMVCALQKFSALCNPNVAGFALEERSRPCLVVGASGNIGEPIAAHLLKAGRRLALTHSSASMPMNGFCADGAEVRWYGVDVGNADQVTGLLARRLDKHHFEQLFHTGRVFCADDLLALGIVDVVVDTGQGKQAVENFVQKRIPVTAHIES